MLTVFVLLLHVAASRSIATIISKEVHADHSITLDCKFPPVQDLSVSWVVTAPDSAVDKRILRLSRGTITKDDNVEWRGDATTGNAALKIVRARMSDAGRYRCKIYRGPNLTWECITELRVHRNQKREVIPQVNTNVNGFVGDDILLPCKVPPGAELNSVKWEDSTKMLFYYSRKYPENGNKDPKVQWSGDLSHRDASAVLLRAAAADSGRYKCEVLGHTGTVLMVNVHVAVEPRPTAAAGGATTAAGGATTAASGGGGVSPTDGPSKAPSGDESSPSKAPSGDESTPSKSESSHPWWVVLVCIFLLHIVACLLIFSYMRRKGFKFEKKSGSRRSTHVETQLVNSEEVVGAQNQQENSPTYVNVYEDMRHGPQRLPSHFDNNTYNENAYVIADNVDNSVAAAAAAAGPTSRPAAAMFEVGCPDFEPAPKPTSVYEDMCRSEASGMLVMVDNPAADGQLWIESSS